MAALAASMYLLSCCKPIITLNSHRFCVEKPTFVNLYNYPVCNLCADQYGKCTLHRKLSDHCMVSYTSCTDSRSWSLDKHQKRRYILDIINGRIRLCCKKDKNEEEYGTCEVKKEQKTNNPGEKLNVGEVCEYGEKVVFPCNGIKYVTSCVPSKNVKNEYSELDLTPCIEKPHKTATAECEEIKYVTRDPCEGYYPNYCSPTESLDIDIKRVPFMRSFDFDCPSLNDTYDWLNIKHSNKMMDCEISGNHAMFSSPGKRSSEGEVLVLTREIIQRLGSNLDNLQTSFNSFSKKNKAFLQNLNCEKQYQIILEQKYNAVMRENDDLRRKNDYLKMVNVKQIELFKKELDKISNENNSTKNNSILTAYLQQIHKLEVQIKADQEKLKYYKVIENKFKEVIDNGDKEMLKLKDDIKQLRNKETTLLCNYVKVLNFLEDIKKSLNEKGNREFILPCITNDSDIDPNLKGLMESALTGGVESLKDLSTLHNAIKDFNAHCCSHKDVCEENQLSRMLSRFSMIHTEDSDDCKCKELHGCNNFSFYPSKQRPTSSHGHYR